MNESRVITVSRILDIPRTKVWEAWTHPEHITRWWGPTGFTNTIENMDVRPGGSWKHIMHGPDGKDYPNDVTFDVVNEPEDLSFTHHENSDLQIRPFKTVVTFEDLGGKTKITLQNRFVSAAEKQKQIDLYHADAGAEQTLERLAGHLAREM